MVNNSRHLDLQHENRINNPIGSDPPVVGSRRNVPVGDALVDASVVEPLSRLANKITGPIQPTRPELPTKPCHCFPAKVPVRHGGGRDS